MSVAARSDSTTGSPIVRLGTKCASMTSTCSQSAPSPGAPRTAAASSARRAKSEARMLGAIIGRTLRGYAEACPRTVREHPGRGGSVGGREWTGRVPNPPAAAPPPELAQVLGDVPAALIGLTQNTPAVGLAATADLR